MQNLSGAMRVCEELGLDREAFYRSMQDFQGASLRLEAIYEKGGAKAYRDYAHAPSKVRATVDAVKQQHPSDPLIAVLELHTFSSLDPGFIVHYAKSMDAADAAFVFYDPKAVAKKGHGELPEESVRKAFARDDLRVHTDMNLLQEELSELLRTKEAPKLLFMSSGAFQGKDLENLSEELLS
jgi:UDP-N-acetylmuramate: L-alanyl-gamma-D-glutamyl-meso-diaminopimelate ligase